MTEAKKIINIDEGDENADWIKNVNGGRSRIRELAIHRQLAAKYRKEQGKDALDTNSTPASDAEGE